MTATLRQPVSASYGRHFRSVAPGTPLTRWEQEILDLVSHGCTNAVTAARMGMAVEAVKLCLRAVFIRLEAHDRAHAVRRGFELGYLTAEVTS